MKTISMMLHYLDFILIMVSIGPGTCHIIFSHSPETLVATFGDDVLFHCAAYDDTNFNRTLTYIWYLNAGLLPNRSAIFANHSLLVQDVQREDVGNYTCVVYTGDGVTPLAISPSATIILSFINSFVIHPKSLNVTEGETISLECVTGESAPPPVVNWEKNGFKFTQGSQYNSTFKSSVPSELVQQTSMKLVMVAHPSQNGMYSCVARNPMLNIEVRSMQANLHVKAIEKAPYLNTTLYQRNILAPQGSNLLLPCPVSGYPLPKITWYRDNKPLSSDLVYMFPNGTLYFVGLRAEYESFYFCVGSNRLGNHTSPEIVLQLAYIDLEFQREPDPVFVVAGQPVTLPCSPPKSFPPANVTWYRNNQQMNISVSSNTLIIVDAPNGVWDLFISHVQKDNEGEYFCIAVNNFAIPMSRTSRVATLIVGGAPSFIFPPLDQRIVKGQGLSLQCVVEGDPTPRVTWYLDRVPLDEGPKITTRLNGQELHIRDMDKSLQGMYTCQASNFYGNAEMSAQVFVVVPPVITDPLPGRDPEEYLMKAGQNVTIRCAVYGDPTPNVTWYKDNILLEAVGRFYKTSEGLFINNISSLDSGQYKCLVINEGGSTQAYANLKVQVPPQFVTLSNSTAVLIGQSLTLMCEVMADPAALVTWLFNNTYNLPLGAFLSSDNTKIMVSMMSWQQVGAYTCIASNSVGSISKVIKVSLQVPPDISMILGNTVVYLDHDTELTCATSGIPVPEVTWYRNGKPLASSKDGRVVITTAKHLLLRFVQAVDAGEYTCRASSAVGTTEKAVSLYVVESPLPPLLLTPVTRSSTSVTLTWTPATQRPQTIVEYYTVYLKMRETFEYERVAGNIAFGKLSHVVDNLQPGTEYLFKMSATNQAGEGGQSNSRSTKTFDSGPSEPRNVKIIYVNATAIQLQWEVPQTTNGIVRKYRIWYKPQTTNGVMMSVEMEADQPTMTYTVSNLSPYTGYEFSVQGATIQDNVDMWGQLSNILSTRTAIGVPSGSPVDVTATVISTTIQLNWKAVLEELQNGPITMYRIRYNTMDNQSYSTIDLTNVTIETTNVSGLLPWRMYLVAMTAGTDAGFGPYSNTVAVRTAPEAPVASPLSVSLTALTSDTIQVSFKLPLNETWNSDLSGFYVRSRKSGSNISQTVLSRDLSSLSVNIIGLEAWTVYEVSVALYTDLVTDGLSPYSSWVTVRTLEAVPDQVTEVNHQSTPTSVMLSWKPPIKPNGVILGYYIEYRRYFPEEVTALTSDYTNNISLSAVDSIESRDVLNITTKETAVTLTDLTPSTMYSISISAFTSVGLGKVIFVNIQTMDPPAPPPPSTYVSTEISPTTEESQYQSSKGDDSEILPAIVAGCAAGVILIMFIVVLIMCLCIKVKEKDRQVLYSDTSNSEGFGDEEPESASSGSSTRIVAPNNGDKISDRGSITGIDLQATEVKYHKTQEYSDMKDSQSMADPAGIENPGYRVESTIGYPDMESVAVSMDMSPEDFYSQASTTLKRKSKMKNESAAAIAALRNRNILGSSTGDKDSLINNDTVVVYAERTAL